MTIAITTFNRTDLLFESYSEIVNDARIKEIVIIDDCSDPSIFAQVLKETSVHSKIKLFRNEENVGMLENKKRAVQLSREEWVILFDSDNIIDSSYLDALPKELSSDTIYCPSFAKPDFDYREYDGMTFDKTNAKNHLQERMFRCAMNTCNYLVNRAAYLQAWTENSESKGSDTIWFNYSWLKQGGKFYVVPDMHYFHRRHDGSGWLKDHQHNIYEANKTIKLIEQL